MAMQRTMPVLQVRDVRRSVAFYETLGFAPHGFWGDGPDFCIVQRGAVTLALDRSRDGRAPPVNQWWAAYIYVDDADRLHAELAAYGIAVTALCDQEYGCRDFDVIDIDGHRIGIGMVMDTGGLSPGLSVDVGRG